MRNATFIPFPKLVTIFHSCCTGFQRCKTCQRVSASVENEPVESVKIYNLAGQRIAEHFSGEFSVSGLAGGIYIVSAQTGNGVFSEKLVVE